MHNYGEALVVPNEIQPIASYVTPTRGGAVLVGAILWSGIPSEFHIYHNGKYVLGGRTSAASPTLQLDCQSCALNLAGNDILLVMGEHSSDESQILKAVLLVELL